MTHSPVYTETKALSTLSHISFVETDTYNQPVLTKTIMQYLETLAPIIVREKDKTFIPVVC